ncbi:PD-(D/E)XK nuclease family protein [filamentous cyanobacterium LEGE 11480]|uniref:PD-(D/E)XK nuclease family protein n=1 Tax=Romeriopsis navalis LEGE 11480 TaxID=2777977 RepID=A0A928VVX5_9CYAN|nr:PD-(D/E)XK nuclease family protein [Romeriopsis navalis]MBE9033179.1 PD-(D/E)XK nuclease family protein [Romeriopsis navalis LEGE 11480]
MRLSQSNLKLLSACPRKFQHLYLDQYAVPVGLEQVERMAEGSQFHLLMQQHSLGLPINALLEGDPQLKTWFETFQQQRSQILRLEENEQILWQQSEHLRTISHQGHVLTVVYDWVMLGATQGQIIDWKTYPKPLKAKRLEQDWQTRLYLYVLAKTTTVVPEQLVMTYWFFQSRPDDNAAAQSIRVRYSTQQYEQTQAELDTLLTQLSQWLSAYNDGQAELPQVDIEKGQCENCAFALRCGRTNSVTSSSAISLAAFAEVEI